MAVAYLDRFQAGVSIMDSPVGYTPSIGNDMRFYVYYHQRLAGQPSTFNYSNLGTKWTFNWISYIAGGPTNAQLEATHFEPNGGQQVYSGYEDTHLQGSGTTYADEGDFMDGQAWTGASLHYRQSPERYERWLPDGTIETFSQAIGTSPNRLFFLTSIKDPRGNITTLAYDSTMAASNKAQLTSVTDPQGNTLTFAYDGTDTLKIVTVTRSLDSLYATLAYTSGKLTSITDTLGIVSSFQYTSGTNFINQMTTPYGNTTFSSSDGSGYLEAAMTNPLGQVERVEYQQSLSTSLFPATESVAPSATGLTINNANLNNSNSFYWNRHAMDTATTNSISVGTTAFYALAQVSHWATGVEGAVPCASSVKAPKENRVWYNYQGQSNPDGIGVRGATATTLIKYAARVLDDGTTTQISFADYNPQRNVTHLIDPLGRTTTFTYASNGLDLTSVARATGTASSDTLFQGTSYNSKHEPLGIKDASGQTYSFAYNTQGQILTFTNPKGEVTTYAYAGMSGSGTGNYLKTLTGNAAHAVTAFTYDSAGRVATVTDKSDDSHPYALTYSYDNLDRLTRIDYPVGSPVSPDVGYELVTYGAYNSSAPLNVVSTTDRQGRTTSYTYDAIGEPLSVTDPLGRVTRYAWCTCGGMASLTDPNGHVTSWGRDLEGRVISKTYPDSSQTTYTYESTTSRLHRTTDAAGSTATHTYGVDDLLYSTTYTAGSGVASTHRVDFTYDTHYTRLTSMADVTGTTTYSYNAPYVSGSAIVGGNRLYQIKTPIATGTATISHTYDALGRVVGRDIDGTGASATYDSLGRISGVSNALGAFSYSYVDASGRLAGITAPTSPVLTQTFAYSNAAGDLRLQEILNKTGSSTNLSKFDFTYNGVGTIAGLTEAITTGTAVVTNTHAYGYDNADQLTGHTIGGTSANAYTYDKAGNRLQETTPGGSTLGAFNNLNQLTLYGTAVNTTVAGTVSKLSDITILANGISASVTGTSSFSATMPLFGGTTNTVSVTALDTSGNQRTNKYTYTPSGGASGLIYDANGNVITDEKGNTYKWDARNRLTAIIYGTASPAFNTHTEFTYDGLDRRTQIAERTGTAVGSGTYTSTKNYLWVGSEIAEERNSGNTVQKRFFLQGERQSGTPYYYTCDYLGSVREFVDASGAIQARYSYDPYGKTTKVSGTPDATFQYAGYFAHSTSRLNLSLYRIYDADVGRWLSRDPLGEGEDSTLYSFAFNNPITNNDPLGLDIWVEEAVPGKPYIHQRLAVGNPNGNYSAYEFALASIIPSPTDGAITTDNPSDAPGGAIAKCMYSKTSPQTDAAIKQYLDSLLMQRASYGPNSNCRTFAQTGYTSITKVLGPLATPSAPPPTPGRATGSLTSGEVLNPSTTTGLTTSTTVTTTAK